MSSALSGLGLLEGTRALDYVNLQGLSTLTGCSTSQLDVLLLKELIDNGLDASKGSKPSLQVELNTVDDLLHMKVSDNGVGLSLLDIERISDFEKHFSSKFFDKLPTRGALGCATKVIAAAPHALARVSGVSFSGPPVIIRSGSFEFNVDLLINEFNETVEAVTEVGEADFDINGTEVSVTLPVYEERWGWKGEYVNLLHGYALLTRRSICAYR